MQLSPAILFSQNEQHKDVAHKSVRGGIITLGSTGLMFGINIIRTVILARLLTPKDFGIIGMVAVFINFVAMFKDAGLSTATIQKSVISNEQISTLAWLNLIITATFGLILFIGSPAISFFYGKPELTAVTMALASSFVLSGLTIQHRALLQRHMRFDLLALTTIISTTGGLVVSVMLALIGWSYWALVAGTISMTILDGLLTFFFCPWMPSKMQKGTGVRGMLKFGIHLTGSSFANYFSRSVDKILIGKLVGAEALGVYNKAYELFRMPTNNILSPIRNVAVPALSSLQKKNNQFKKYYGRIIALTATMIFPVSIYFYIEADFFIPLVLGPQWMEAIPVFKILAIGGLIQPITGQSGILMITTGNSKRYLQWQIFYSICLVVSFIVGVQWGIFGLVTAYVIAEFALFVPSLLHNYKNTPVSPKTVLDELKMPILISLFSAFILLLFKNYFYSDNEWIRLLYAFIFFGIYAALTWQRKDMRITIRSILNKLRP